MSDPFLTDLALSPRAPGVGSSDRDAVNLLEAHGDLLLARGRQNLAQALLNRLYTRRGALAGLGHPTYGSRLYLLVGEPDSRRTRALAEYYIRESLLEDPRVEEVAEVVFESPGRQSVWRDVLVVHVRVVPRGDGTPLSLSVTTKLAG